MSGDKPQGREGYYVGKDGKKADAEIHEPILDGISEEAHRAHRLESFHRAVAIGIPVDEAAKLYGLESEDIILKPRR
jgi:hypothetical protein